MVTAYTGHDKSVNFVLCTIVSGSLLSAVLMTLYYPYIMLMDNTLILLSIALATDYIAISSYIIAISIMCICKDIAIHHTLYCCDRLRNCDLIFSCNICHDCMHLLQTLQKCTKCYNWLCTNQLSSLPPHHSLIITLKVLPFD